MRKVLALVALLVLAVSALCCAPKPSALPPDVTTTTMSRSFELTLHVDEDFTTEAREEITSAARAWHVVTDGRVALRVEFDVDFNSPENLREHKDARHALVIGVVSTLRIVDAIDAAMGGKAPGKSTVAVTVLSPTTPPVVFLIVDRIEDGKFLSVVTHEFGHVIGLPDMPAIGSIMSGASVIGVPPPSTFTRADVELCRAFFYCR